MGEWNLRPETEWFLEELGASNMNGTFSNVSWPVMTAFIDCAYRQRIEDRDVIEMLEREYTASVSGGKRSDLSLWTGAWEEVHVAVEEMSWFLDEEVTDDTLLKFGCYMGLIRHKYAETNWHAQHMRKAKAALIRIPAPYIFALTPEAAVEETTMFHLATIAEMNANIPFSFILELGMSNTPSSVATYWGRGVPADYVVEFKKTLFPGREFYSTISTANMLGEAVEAGASAEYLARGMRMKLKPADIIRMAREGVPFEYLAAYYENETL